MEGYFKRFFIGHFLILVIAAGFGFYFGLSFISIIAFVLLFELLIYFLNVKYVGKRKTELANKINEIFAAVPVSEGVLKFNLESYEIYAKIVVDLKLGISQIANIELVYFHIPRNQISQTGLNHGLELKEGKINGIRTYHIYQTDVSGLKFAKEFLEKKIARSKATAGPK